MMKCENEDITPKSPKSSPPLMIGTDGFSSAREVKNGFNPRHISTLCGWLSYHSLIGFKGSDGISMP